MKKRNVLFFMILVMSASVFAQYPVGNRTVTYTDPDRGGRSVETVFYYPATVAGANQPFAIGDFPLIVFGHGFSMGQDAYGNFVSALVPHGYILAFPTTEGGMSPSHGAFGADLEFLVRRIKMEGANNVASFLYGHVGETSALMGHSMGGGSSFLAAANNMNINALINFAAAETNPSAIAAAANVHVPVLMLIGQNDGVTPPATHQIPMYNALGSLCKTMITIQGGGHCYFANYNLACSTGETFTSPQPTITRAQQHSVVNDFLLPYLNFILKGDQAQRQLFQDSLVASNRITYTQSCSGTDLALASIVQPASSCGLTASENVKVKVVNLAANSVSTFDVSYSVNGGSVFTETVNTTLHTGQHLYHTFSQSQNMYLPGQYAVTTNVSVVGDMNTANNSVSKTISNTSVLLPQSVDFTGFTGANLSTVFPNWREAQGTAPSGAISSWVSRTGLGSGSNITAKVNMYSSPVREWIIGPSFLVTHNTILTFDAAVTAYNSNNLYAAGMPSNDAMIVKISTDCGVTWSDLFVINSTNQPQNILTEFSIALAAYSGQIVSVAFYASRIGSTSADYDFHIDNILVKDYPQFDPQIIAMSAPLTESCYSINENIWVEIVNNGIATIDFSNDPLTVSAVVNGPTGVQNISGVVSSGSLAPASANVFFVASGVDMSEHGTYQLNFEIFMVNDGNTNNNMFSAEITNNIPVFEISGPSFVCNGNSAQLDVNVLSMGQGVVANLTNTTSASIPDNNTVGVNSVIIVSNAIQTMAWELIDVTVNITHPFTGDLILTLRAPNNSSVVLSNRRGGSGDHYINTIFRMNAQTPIASGVAPFTDVYIPDEPFSQFTGSANGNWTLNVSDRASGDVGTLQNWSMKIRIDNQIVVYFWSTGESTPSISVAPVANETYQLTITDAHGCQSTENFYLTVMDVLNFSLGNDTSICNGQSVVFDVGSGHNTITWHDLSTAQTYTATTSEVVSVEVVNLCGTFTDAVTVSVLPLPIPNLGSDTTVCVNDPIILNPGSGFSSYLWSTGETSAQILVSSPLPGLQIYSVTVTDANGCQGNDVVQVDYEICTFTQENQMNVCSFYPNPAQDEIIIMSYFPLGKVNCKIISADGRIIDEFGFEGSLNYDVKSLASGIYLIVFEKENKLSQKSILIKN